MLRPTSQVGADVLPEPARVADRDRGSQRAEEPQRGREDVAAHEVEDDVDLVERAELVVRHALDGAQRTRQLLLLGAADRGDGRAVQRADDLNRRRTDRTRRRGDEHARAEGDASELGEGDPGGQERHREGGALREGGLRRKRQEPPPVDDSRAPHSRLPPSGRSP